MRTKQGITIVGWHAAESPAQWTARLFANVTTDAMEVAKVAAMKAIADSNGTAGVVVFADSAYAIAIARGRAMEAQIKKCAGCKVLASRTRRWPTPPIACRNSPPRCFSRFGAKWTHSLAINDLYYDFMGPSLSVAGLKGATASAEHFRRRRFGIRLSAYSQERIPVSHRSRAAQHAGLAAR